MKGGSIVSMKEKLALIQQIEKRNREHVEAWKKNQPK